MGREETGRGFVKNRETERQSDMQHRLQSVGWFLPRHEAAEKYLTTEEQRRAEKKQAEELLKTEGQRGRVICNIDFSLLGARN
ncbi:MAG: hypothetical protein LHW57_00495 [Candidatus Cloacimonetes bacterium]|jgi:hypothetical protein|nr:hypothetical protein [Candidatus Cloacimonadota bacterium]